MQGNALGLADEAGEASGAPSAVFAAATKAPEATTREAGALLTTKSETASLRRKRPREEDYVDQSPGASLPSGIKDKQNLSQSKLRCPLCPARSQKRFAPGRSFRAHLRARHKDDAATAQVQDWELFETSFRPRAEAFTVSCEKEESLRKSKIRKKTASKDPVVVQTSPQAPGWVALAQNDALDKLKSLESGEMWSIESRDRLGATAEHYAAGAGAMSVLRYCVARRHARCPFHASLHEADSQGVTDEQACTCSPTLARRKDGRAALHWACRNGQLEAARYLVQDCHEEIGTPTFDGSTPLMYAIFGANLPVAKAMVQWGADPKAKNSWACGLVHWLAISRCKDEARVRSMCDWIARDLGLSFSTVQKEGRSPLHKAAYIDNRGVVGWMLDNLTDEELRNSALPDNGGQRPSSLAMRAHHKETASLLHVLEARLEGPQNARNTLSMSSTNSHDQASRDSQN